MEPSERVLMSVKEMLLSESLFVPEIMNPPSEVLSRDEAESCVPRPNVRYFGLFPSLSVTMREMAELIPVVAVVARI